MKSDASKILEAALKLPLEARAAIAGSLIESLDTEVDEDVEAAWAEEIARRVRDLDSGKAKKYPTRSRAVASSVEIMIVPRGVLKA